MVMLIVNYLKNSKMFMTTKEISLSSRLSVSCYSLALPILQSFGCRAKLTLKWWGNISLKEKVFNQSFKKN